MLHVWLWFTEDFWPYFGNNGFAIQSLTYTEIKDWATLRDQRPTPFEVSLLMKLHAIMRVTLTKKKNKGATTTNGRGKEVPVTEVSAQNTEGVRALLKNFDVRARAIKARQEKQERRDPK